jgi:predicted transcriptional regulator
MAASTTLKLPEPLKARISSLAKAAGKTPHAFMVEALESQVRLAEQRRNFVQAALTAEQEVEKCATVYSADEVHRYLRQRLAGKKARRPAPVKR